MLIIKRTYTNSLLQQRGRSELNLGIEEGIENAVVQRQRIINRIFWVCKQLIIRKACVLCKFGSTLWGANADKIQFHILLLDLLNNLFTELACQLPAQRESCKSNICSGKATCASGALRHQLFNASQETHWQKGHPMLRAATRTMTSSSFHR